MNSVLNRKTISAVLFGSLIALASVAPALAASLNNDPQDFTTLRATNYSSNPDCNACWSTTANVNVGEIVSFAIYYHNTGPDTANNVKARISTSISGDGRTITASGNVSADNAGLVSGSSQVTLPSGSKATSLTHLATIWRPNQTVSGSAGFLFGQNGTEVFGGSGVNLGNIASGWQTQGSVLVRYRIEGTRGDVITPTTNAPQVNTLSPTDIERTSARLRGEANPRGDSAETWFEWGTSSSNLSRETSRQSMGSGNSFVSFSNSVTGLDANTDYFYRAVAKNSNGTVRGDIRSFSTMSGAVVAAVAADRPSVRILGATGITSSGATCRGEVNPNGNQTDAWFEWGSTTSLGNRTSAVSVGSGSSFVSISSILSGLHSNTPYYCKLVAENSAGRSISDVESFRTNTLVSVTPPSVITQVVRVITREAEVPAEEVVKLTLKADKSDVSDNKITYIATYENLTTRTLRDASIEVNLPDKLKFDNASRSVTEVKGNTLVFRLGTIRGGERGEIDIDTTAKSLKAGDVMTVRAILR